MDAPFSPQTNQNVPSVDESVKRISIHLEQQPKVTKKDNSQLTRTITKEKAKRAIVSTDKWNQILKNIDHDVQLQIIKILCEKYDEKYGISNIISRTTDGEFQLCVDYTEQQIQTKRNGYKYQDVQKKIYDEQSFISYRKILELLVKSGLLCYYCKEKVFVIYEYIREVNQWSLERINNDYGHNHDNVEIACLRCNLRRRTMNHEKFLATKQIKFVKVNNGEV
jgi:hypothetical protein